MRMASAHFDAAVDACASACTGWARLPRSQLKQLRNSECVMGCSNARCEPALVCSLRLKPGLDTDCLGRCLRSACMKNVVDAASSRPRRYGTAGPAESEELDAELLLRNAKTSARVQARERGAHSSVCSREEGG